VIALDTNIFIYAITDDDTEGRHGAACDLLERIARSRAIVPLQVVGEYLNVCKKRQKVSYTAAMDRADHIMRVYHCLASTPPDYLRAAITAHRYRLQFFDSLIITVARRAGATILLSEDMADGMVVDGLTVVNPFVAANNELLAQWLA
jgi:predicted nucleic acid-binding protein